MAGFSCNLFLLLYRGPMQGVLRQRWNALRVPPAAWPLAARRFDIGSCRAGCCVLWKSAVTISGAAGGGGSQLHYTWFGTRFDCRVWLRQCEVEQKCCCEPHGDPAAVQQRPQCAKNSMRTCAAFALASAQVVGHLLLGCCFTCWSLCRGLRVLHQRES